MLVRAAVLTGAPTVIMAVSAATTDPIGADIGGGLAALAALGLGGLAWAWLDIQRGPVGAAAADWVAVSLLTGVGNSLLDAAFHMPGSAGSTLDRVVGALQTAPFVWVLVSGGAALGIAIGVLTAGAATPPGAARAADVPDPSGADE